MLPKIQSNGSHDPVLEEVAIAVLFCKGDLNRNKKALLKVGMLINVHRSVGSIFT